MKLENIILSEVSQAQKPKAAFLILYVEYRSNTNISNITYPYK
jgi:hypothetical protein